MPNLNYIIFFAWFLCSCGTKAKISQTDLTLPYSKNESIDFEYRLIHQDSLYSTLYLKIPTGKYQVRWSFYSHLKTSRALSQDSLFIESRDSSIWQPIHWKNTPQKGFVYIEIKGFIKDILCIDKKNIGKQTLWAINAENKKILHQNYISKGRKLHFGSTYLSDSIYIRYYDTNFIAAPPPYSKKQPDFEAYFSHFKKKWSINSSTDFRFDEDGVYFISTTKNTSDGIFMNVYPDDFPIVRSIQDLIEPLCYITKKEEYQALKNAENLKKALDNFWLDRHTNKEKVKRLLSSYYRRVQEANKLFSSYKEGWKTDKGMIYILFGKPLYIRVLADHEYWYYPFNTLHESTEFYFLSNDEEFILQRNPLYKEAWEIKVFEWRHARVIY